MGILPERTARFEAFVAPARRRPALWRLVLGSALAASVWLAVVVGLVLVGDGLAVPPEAASRATLLGYLASFAALILGLGIAVRLLHARSPATLLGPTGRPDRRGFVLGFGIVAAISIASFALAAFVAPPSQQLPLGLWLAWAVPAALAILLQSGAEELAFRGYLMQQLAARFRSPLAWWLLPALAFGALHWSPAQFGSNAWLVVVAATLIGLIAGDVTARTGNLGAAIGLHFANNVTAILFLAPPSELSALALFILPIDPMDEATMRAALIGDIASILVAYAAYLWIVARRRRLRA
jgi:uncharacterized protein